MSSSRRMGGGLAVLLAAVLLGSGVSVVETGEVAVVFRLGAVRTTSQAGLRVRAPWPLERDTRVAVSEVRRVEPGPLRLLTGDTNLIDLDVVVQYTVSDPVAYLLALEDPEGTVAALATSAATHTVAEMAVDRLLTTGRSELERRVLESTQARLDALGAGLRLQAVEVRELSPPPAVVDAFNDVSSARGDRETLALSAEAYASRVLPEVRGQRAERVETARATASQRRARALSDIDRFEVLHAADRVSPEATRARLRAETARHVSERARIHTLPARGELFLSALATQDVRE